MREETPNRDSSVSGDAGEEISSSVRSDEVEQEQLDEELGPSISSSA